MKKRLFFIVLVVFFFVSSSYSEDGEDRTTKSSLQHQITVTANRVETPENEVASSVTVITRKELQRMNKSTVLEALEGVMGLVFTQNGPPGSSASLLMRGANSEHTKIMIDGVEINDPITPGRTFDLSLLLLDNVEQIEILRGPQSTLYGSDAMAGVVNIITRKGEGKGKIEFSSRAGSYGTREMNAVISGGKKIWSYSFGASYLATEGVSAAGSAYSGNQEKDGVRNQSFSWRFDVKPRENLSFDIVLKSINTRLDIDNFGGAYGDDPNNVQTYDAFLFKTGFKGLFLNNRWEQKFYVSLLENDRQYDNPKDEQNPFSSEDAFYKSRIFKIDWQHNLFLNKTNTLTFGFEHLREQGESEYNSMGLYGPFSSFFPLKKAHLTSAYVQDKIRLADRFFAAVGARLDSHNRFGSAVTFRIAPSYYIETTGTRLKATYGTGFKAPSLYQLYAPGTFWGPVGNEDLEPERSTGWDTGFEQSFFGNRFLLGATYFHSNYENLVLFDYVMGYVNVGEAVSTGAEVFLKGQPVENMSFSASYTRTDAKDKKTDSFLLRRPRNKFSASMDFSFKKKANITLTILHIGEREDMAWIGWTSTRMTMDAFTLLNGTVSYNLIPGFEIYMRLDNILDSEYELVKGYGTLGFAIYGGIKILIQ